MKTRLLFVVALGACTQQPQQDATPLNKLGTTKLEIVSKDQVAVELHVDESAGCPILASDVLATFDGEPMHVARGGYDVDSNGCYPIAFWADSKAVASMAGWEKSNSGSQLTVVDHSALWTIATTKLLSNDFVIDRAAARITWGNVAQISTASITPSVPVHIDGNNILYPAGLDVTWVVASAQPAPTRCDGPSRCTVGIQASRQLGAITP